MENLNNVPSTGTFGGSINQVNQNFGLVKDAIENVEGRTIRSKGLFPTQAALTAAYPSPKVGDYAYVGSSLPATIYDCEVEGTWHNTQQQGGSESVPLNNYPTKSEMNAAIAAIEIETVDNLNEETAASGKALDAHQGFVLAGQIDEVQEAVDEVGEISTTKEVGNKGNAITGYVINANGVWSAQNNEHQFWAVPVNGGEQYMIVGNASVNSYYAWLTNVSYSAGGRPSYATGESGRHAVESNKSVIVTAPDNAHFMYLCNKNAGTVQNPQAFYKLTKLDSRVNVVEKKATDVLTDIHEVKAFTRVPNYVIGTSNGKWLNREGDSFVYYKVQPNEEYVIKVSGSYTANYTFLTGIGTPAAGGTPLYCDGYSTVIGIVPTRELRIVVPQDAMYLYITKVYNGTDRSPESISFAEPINKKVTEIGTEVYEGTHSNIQLDLDSYPSSPYMITAGGTWSGSDVSRSHKVIPIGDYDTFVVTTKTTSEGFYAWLKSDRYSSGGNPDYADGETGRYRLPMNETTVIRDIPSTAKYLYIQCLNNTDYTPDAVYGRALIANGVTSNTERISALEGNTSFTKPYEGGKIDLRTYHYDISEWADIKQAHQSATNWGDYCFMVTNYESNIYIYNLATKTLIQTWNNPVSHSGQTHYHANQCTFGNLYYDESDYFPLLYITVNMEPSGQYQGRCSQEVYRVVAEYDEETGTYSSFDFVLVQKIYLPVMTTNNDLGNANMAIDRVRNRMVFYSRYQADGSNKWCKITEMRIPEFTAVAGDTLQVVVLEDSNILNSYFIDSPANDMQGATIYAGKLFIGRGSGGAGYIQLIVVDLIQKSQIARLELLDEDFTQEPEGVFIYNGKLIISTNYSSSSSSLAHKSGFYKIEFE